MILMNNLNLKLMLINFALKFLIQGKKNFVDTIKEKITIKLFQEGLFDKISDIYDAILNELYKNIQLYK